MIKKYIQKNTIKLFFIILITVATTFVSFKALSTVWYIYLLILYFKSKDEPFWLAFYLSTVDGFLGFLGTYSVTIKVIPGLPAIEVAQFYIIISVVKAFRSKKRPYVFYEKYLVVLLLYLIFLVVWGQLIGLRGELNVFFRIFKLTLPMLLFYSIPRLFPNSASYRRLFTFVFIFVILASMTQVFMLVTGFSLGGYIHLTEEQISEAGMFREFANAVSTLLGLFGALIFLSYKEPMFNRIYLYFIIVCAFVTAYLSASRGWIVFFLIVICLSFIFAYKFSLKRLFGFGVVFAMILFLGLDNPIIKKQSDFSIKRLATLGALAGGDITAGGTLGRLSERGPRVMKKWAENPVIGWGFSDVFFDYDDGHVANQNILLFSGVIGLILLIGFLLFFSFKLFIRYLKLPKYILNKNAYLVFIFMLMGWFFLHSSGAQHFSYYGMPLQIIPQAVFFSFGALFYAKPSELSK